MAWLTNRTTGQGNTMVNLHADGRIHSPGLAARIGPEQKANSARPSKRALDIGRHSGAVSSPPRLAGRMPVRIQPSHGVLVGESG